MPTSRSCCRALAALALSIILAPLPAQTPVRWLQRPELLGPAFATCEQSALAFDRGRGRLLFFNTFYPGVRTIGIPPLSHQVWERTSRWTLRAPGPNPPPGRVDFGFALDEQRGEGVLFGGNLTPLAYQITAADDTWLWDGFSWRRADPAASPAARWGHALAYDRGRGRTVLFGGGRASCRACLLDTWEWDGISWLRRDPATAPPGRYDHAMAYDAGRGVVVLTGGIDGGGTPRTDTWEWDGSDWRRAPTANVLPVARPALAFDEGRSRMVRVDQRRTWEWVGSDWMERFPLQVPAIDCPTLSYDAARRRVVLVGMASQREAWEWDGADWTRATELRRPPARTETAMVDDPTRGRLFLFGGRALRQSLLDDTWEWDGLRWRDRSTSSKPSARAGHAMAAFPAGGAVLFGGEDAGRRLGDTWVFDGNAWGRPATSVNPSPAPRAHHAMVLDAARRRVVLFGGADGIQLGDTWEWTANGWMERLPATTPPARSRTAIAYDAARQRVVLFGGNAAGRLLDDTWEWDGTDWLQRQPAQRPAPRESHVMAYDAASQRVVLVGGSNTPDTWLWDGTVWTPLPAGGGTGPVRPNAGALASDSTRGHLLLFGGQQLGFGNANDVWRLGAMPVASTAVQGPGCGGAAGPPWLTGMGDPHVGNATFALDLRASPSTAAVLVLGATPANLALGHGCVLAVDPTQGFVAAGIVTNAGGFASVPLPVPATLTITTVPPVYAQAAALDATAPLGFGLSAARRIEFGF